MGSGLCDHVAVALWVVESRTCTSSHKYLSQRRNSYPAYNDTLGSRASLILKRKDASSKKITMGGILRAHLIECMSALSVLPDACTQTQTLASGYLTVWHTAVMRPVPESCLNRGQGEPATLFALLPSAKVGSMIPHAEKLQLRLAHTNLLLSLDRSCITVQYR
jgi:hypothetical protein